MMTDQDLKDLVANLATIVAENSQEMKVLAATMLRIQEKAEINQEKADRNQEKADRERKEMNRQIGDLHRKWGTFTEALLMPSIEKTLYDKFGIGVTAANYRARRNGEEIELDAFGYVNSDINTAVIVEVKSHLRPESITQMLTTMERFIYFWPDHADKKLYGIMACINAPQNLRGELRKHGIYLAVIDDVLLNMQDTALFQPTDFNLKKN
jgi:hypothetical protein